MFAVVVLQNISRYMALCFGSVMQHGGVVSAVLEAGLLFLAAATWGSR